MKTVTDRQTHNKYKETTIMKSDSGRRHRRKRIGIFGPGGYARKF